MKRETREAHEMYARYVSSKDKCNRGISDRPHVPVMHVFSEKIIGPRNAYVVDIVMYPFYISESPTTYGSHRRV